MSVENLSVVQGVVLIVISALLWIFRARLAYWRVPTLVVVFALISAGISAAIGYSSQSILRKEVVTTRFADDPLGAVSRIFRESLEARLLSLGAPGVIRYPKSLNRISDIKKRFRLAQDIHVILVGETKRLSVVFPEVMQRGAARGSLGEKRSRRDSTGFQRAFPLVSRVPAISIQDPLSDSSIDFLAELLAGYSEQVPEARRETYLASAVSNHRPWRSHSARALPALLLGDRILRGMADRHRLDFSDIRCAMKWYARGVELFKASDNPALSSVLYYHWGVAYAMIHWLDGSIESRRAAVKRFERAIHFAQYPRTGDVGQQVREYARRSLKQITEHDVR
jgi:hypothetical protein